MPTVISNDLYNVNTIQYGGGPPGATGPAGTAVGFAEWQPGPATYNQYNIVSYEGILYYWIGPDVGNSGSPPPIDPIRWELVVGGIGATGAASTVAGATGLSGATGVGLTGATGISDVPGATGLSGASGIGETGATGIGETGATGVSVTGASGIAGATGVGLTGATGVSITGATGSAGATGVGVAAITTFTTSSTDQVVVETINASTQRSVKFEMQANTSSQFQASELRLLVDLPNIYLTEYGSIGESLGTFKTYYSPASNDYSSPYINNGGLSVWNGTTLTIYTIHNEVIQGLFSMYAGDTFTFNGGAATATLSSVFTEVSTGIYEATTDENRSPPLLLSRIQWTGTGNIELRYTPFNAVTTLRYIKTEISV